MLGSPRIVDVVLSANANMVDTNVFTVEAGAEYELQEAVEVHGTLGTDGGAVTLDVVKCTGTTAPSAGTSMLASTFNLKSTINTPVTKNTASGLASSLATRTVKGGERVALNFGGTQTAVAGLALRLVFVQRRKSTSR